MSDIVDELRNVANRPDVGYPATMLDAADEITRLRAQNAELLEALQTVLGTANHGQNMTWEERIRVGRAAIAKAG